MKTRTIFALILALGFVLGSVAFASTLPNSLEWDGQGSDSLDCDKLGESPERTADGWIHWIVTQGGGITEAELVLGGSGSGTYEPTKYGPVVEFFTPYFDVETLNATLHYAGTLGDNTQFVISDYCPGVDEDYEELTVSKTAVTSFTRTHKWDIEKSVATEKGYTLNGYPKIWLYIDGSGNETATWTVDVTYEGFEDSDFNVSGVINIENTGTLDAVITSVVDKLAGTTIAVNCGVEFPYTLPAGETLTCTYSEDVDSKIEGFNEVTVTTERDTYFADAEIIWGDPTTEINKTVAIEDVSDLFGTFNVGTVTAPNGDKFTYDKPFAWVDYGADNCGSFTYNNTATIVQTGQSASATLKVNVQCYIWETAYAKGDDAICFIPTFANWGWTNPLPQNTMDLWAGAGRCDTWRGTLVGTTDAWGNITMSSPYLLRKTHVYRGTTMFPLDRRGRQTVAPGQYYIEDDAEWVIVHAEVGIPDPDFGP